ncbi:methyltransferase domain-containing protein [Actinomadura sp. NEAU-AAG7]|uniref:methyltransferase domain-containing protein n=1 Tax=Actinomadura sp. NEAU-AAG7 TaxID=2839640 RepID=UPI001BE3E868|nr:methyltransferase domain-containing protein [Actinomadura sp. NEAU-AAG7]MBT2207122.1 methyltransferase domain-containing protein [Actinomadura sp. NEAU-AAG7]
MGPAIELDSRAAGAIDGRHIRALTFQDVRMEYVTSVLNRLDIPCSGRTALVIGSGRGLLAQGLARLGLGVVALDPSREATAMAQEADTESVQYMTARAEDPGLADASFDVLFYADTFEITDDLDRVVAHAARLLRPGGVLFYDTVNRTPLSRLIYLGAFQALPQTRIMPRGRYTAARLRTPAEVASALAAHGLKNEDVCSFKPTNVLDLVKATVARRSGKIDDRAVKEMTSFILEPEGKPLVTYLGHARTKH